MTAPVLVDQAVPCGNCPAGAKCLPASHNMRHLGTGGWKYDGCRVHRACGEYAPAPAVDVPAAAEAPLVQAVDLDELAPDAAPAEIPVEPVTLAQWLALYGLPANGTIATIVEHVRGNALLTGAFQAIADRPLLASHRVWYCPRCLNGRELPRRCCDVELIRGRLTIRRDDSG